MKVNAINGINQSVSFEKRNKRADKAQAQHQTNPMKAVPLAVLIAMSPLNAPAQNTSSQTNSTTKVEQMMKLAEKDELVSYAVYDNPSGYRKKCLIQLYSLDGGNSIDRIMLNFAPVPAKKKDLEAQNLPDNLLGRVKVSLKLDTLKKVTNYLNDGEKQWVYSEEYFAVGPAKKEFSSFRDKATYELVPNSDDLNFEMMTDNEEVYITEQFYNDLKESLGEQVKYSEVENVTEVKRKVGDDYWFDY